MCVCGGVRSALLASKVHSLFGGKLRGRERREIKKSGVHTDGDGCFFRGTSGTRLGK